MGTLADTRVSAYHNGCGGIWLCSAFQLKAGQFVQARYEHSPNMEVLAMVTRLGHRGAISLLYYFECEVLSVVPC